MTIVLENYSSRETGLLADIEQEKYCSFYTLDVYRPIDDGPIAQSVFRGNYMTAASARRALRRFASDWEKEKEA